MKEWERQNEKNVDGERVWECPLNQGVLKKCSSISHDEIQSERTELHPQT